MSTKSTLLPAQLASLQLLREKFTSVENPDSNFKLTDNDSLYIRYLRARNFNETKAKDMLENTIKWRKEFDLKSVDDWKDVVRVENSTGKIYHRGFDKEGHALLYMKPGKENTNNHDGNLKHLVYNLEKAIRSMEANGQKADKLMLVIDYDGFSFANSPPLKTSLATLNILQNHYPERLFRAYLVRPPWLFSATFTAISPFIDPITKEKIVMMTGDPLSIRNQLLTVVDSKVLESAYGGDDARAFNSELYLSASMEVDYYSALEMIENDKHTDKVNSGVSNDGISELTSAVAEQKYDEAGHSSILDDGLKAGASAL